MAETVAKQEQRIRQRSGKVRSDTITLAHGSGGKAMRDMIDDVFMGAFGNPSLAPLEDQARFTLVAMQAHPAGQDAAIIGEVSDFPQGSVIMHTGFGGERIVDMLVGEQLPRIS